MEGEPMGSPDGTERHVNGELALKRVHLVLFMAGYLLTLGAIYATLRSQEDENTRRVKALEEQTIKDAQFREFRDDVIRQLGRIESKIDADAERHH
jgi:hypothetical protein